MNSDAASLSLLPFAGGRRARGWPDLSDVLLEGESVVFLDVARVRTTRFPRFPRFGRWFVIVTDRRLICLKKSKRAARQQLHVSLQRLEHVFQRGVLGRRVIVSTQRGTIRVLGLSRFAGEQLVACLMAALRGERPALPGRVPGDAAPPALPAVLAEAVVTRVEELESQVDRLTQQVRFLEELLRQRRG